MKKVLVILFVVFLIVGTAGVKTVIDYLRFCTDTELTETERITEQVNNDVDELYEFVLDEGYVA